MGHETDRLGDPKGLNHTDRAAGPQKSFGMSLRQSHSIVNFAGHIIGQLGKL